MMKHLPWIAAMIPCMCFAAVLPKNEPVPGGVVVMQLPASESAPRVSFDGHRIMVIKHNQHWYAIAGIPLSSHPGEESLAVKTTGEPGVHIKFTVQTKHYPEQRLTIKNPKLVNPPPRTLERIGREKAHLNHVLNTWIADATPGLSFIWPVNGPQTSGFGLRRFLNGEARNPHTGIDIGAPAGTPVRAPADGTVADVGHYYFCGNTLTIDLGQGLYSVYCHLSKIRVQPGTHVRQGEVVGAIGATGRATGPNLHWTVSLNGTPVDPHAFIPANAIPPPDKN